jgi:hypothetical protein
VATGKHWEWSRRVVPQVKPFLPPPLHQSEHGDFKVRIYPVPGLDTDDRTLGDRQLSFGILRTLNMKEILPQINLRVDPQVSLTQSHEGRYMQDSQGRQVVKLETVIP